MPLVPIIALTRLRQATLQGLHRVILGQTPELLIRPLLFLGSAWVFGLLVPHALRPTEAVLLQVGAASVAFLAGLAILHTCLPSAIKTASRQYFKGAWIKSAMPLVFLSGVAIMNVQIGELTVGTLKGNRAVGLYSVACRGSEFLGFVLIAVNAALAPVAAALYAQGALERLQKVVTKGARIAFCVSLPLAAGLIIFAGPFLQLFGSEFRDARTPLIILGIGQLVNAATGSVGLLLIMTNHERDVALTVGISAFGNLILTLWLVPMWSATGAAIASAASLIFWNLLLTIQVRRRLAIRPTVLAI